MARLTESDLRRIVRQEAARMVKGARKPLREAKGWYGGGGFGDEPMLDSGDKEVDDLWNEWVSCTDRLLGATMDAGMEEFPQEDGGDEPYAVNSMMRDYIMNR
jgi:hypothetical protein